MHLTDSEGLVHSPAREEVLAHAPVKEGDVENRFCCVARAGADRFYSSGGRGIRALILTGAFGSGPREGIAGPVSPQLAWGGLGGSGFELLGAWDRHFCGLAV